MLSCLAGSCGSLLFRPANIIIIIIIDVIAIISHISIVIIVVTVVAASLSVCLWPPT